MMRQPLLICHDTMASLDNEWQLYAAQERQKKAALLEEIFLLKIRINELKNEASIT